MNEKEFKGFLRLLHNDILQWSDIDVYEGGGMYFLYNYDIGTITEFQANDMLENYDSWLNEIKQERRF